MRLDQTAALTTFIFDHLTLTRCFHAALAQRPEGWVRLRGARSANNRISDGPVRSSGAQTRAAAIPISPVPCEALSYGKKMRHELDLDSKSSCK
jgi:hypothetical protein